MTPERIERERRAFEAWYSRAYLPTAAQRTVERLANTKLALICRKSSRCLHFFYGEQLLFLLE